MVDWLSNSNARLAMIALALFGCIDARAASRGGTPEFYFQPAVGSFAFSLEALQFSPQPTVTYNSAGSKISDTQFTMSGYRVSAQYAFSDAWAFSLAAGTADSSSKVTDQFGSATTKASGMTDLRAQLSSITALGGWSLHVGIGVGLSPAKHNDATAAADGNMMSGGSSLFNYVGLSSVLGSGNYYGFQLSYATLMERTGNTNNGASTAQDYKISGGNRTSLDAFIETDFGGLEADATAGYEFNDPTVNTYAAGNTATYDAYKAMHLGAGIQYQIVTEANLRLGYEMLMNGARGVPSYQAAPYTQSTLTIRARYDL